MSQSDANPGPPDTGLYSLEDWRAVWGWVLTEWERVRSTGSQSFDPKSKSLVVKYFDDKYHERADYCRDRLIYAVTYTLAHSSELDERPFVVVGKNQLLVSETLVSTLWVIFNQLEESE